MEKNTKKELFSLTIFNVLIKANTFVKKAVVDKSYLIIELITFNPSTSFDLQILFRLKMLLVYCPLANLYQSFLNLYSRK